jgi:hypothetical protein
LAILPYFIVALVLVAGIVFPSYTHRPAHYDRLSQHCAESNEPGRANINGEKVFIAASIYDEEGTLVGGDWGRSVLELVDLLGPENVFLSIYENDADEKAKEVLTQFSEKLHCKMPPADTLTPQLTRIRSIRYSDGTSAPGGVNTRHGAVWRKGFEAD